MDFLNASGDAAGTVALKAGTANPDFFPDLQGDAVVDAVVWRNGRLIDLAPYLPPSKGPQTVFGLDDGGDALVFCAGGFYLVPNDGGKARKIDGNFHSGIALSPSGRILTGLHPLHETVLAFNRSGDGIEGVTHGNFNPHWDVFLDKNGTRYRVTTSVDGHRVRLNACPAAINDQDCFVAVAYYSNGSHILLCSPANR